MQTAASLNESVHDVSWRVSREGSVVALVDIRHEGGSVVVSAGPEDSPKVHNFPSLQAADAFTSDLLASFAYLGCDVAKA